MPSPLWQNSGVFVSGKRLPDWLIYQRVGLFLYLAGAVLLLIYALGFISNIYIFYAYGSKGLVDFYNEMQIINDGLLWKAIAAIVFALILFLLQLMNFPAGIVTLIITTVIAAVSVWFCIGSLVVFADIREVYLNLDLSSLNRYIQRGTIKYSQSTFTFDLGIGSYVLFLISSAFMLIIVIRNAFFARGGFQITFSALPAKPQAEDGGKNEKK